MGSRAAAVLPGAVETADHCQDTMAQRMDEVSNVRTGGSIRIGPLQQQAVARSRLRIFFCPPLAEQNQIFAVHAYSLSLTIIFILLNHAQYDITHDDLAQILAENKTPVKRPRKRPGTDNSSDGDGSDANANPASTLLFANPLVSPATSQEICAFVEAATRGGMGGLGLTKERYGGKYGGKDQLEMEKEAAGNNGTAMIAVDPALLGALDVTLRHHNAAHPLLTLRDIGRLATCSQSLSDLVAEAPLWMQLFDRAVQSGRPYGPRTGRAAALARSYKASTVCGENRLLS